MNRIVVVGASAAGLAAAETLRREGFTGPLTLIGEEIDPPYDRPPLSKQILASRWEPERLYLRTEAHLAALAVELRLGARATGLDLASRRIRLAGGAEVPYDGLIIATGVRPRRLPGPPAHVLRTVGDALDLRRRLGPGRRLAVVGAGFLGAEVAAVARGLGCEVVLLEPAPVPLAHAVGEAVGGVLADAHRERGVDVRTGVVVAGVAEEGGVRLAGGGRVAADEVLVAVGSLPNTEWLDGSGLTLADGLVCDRYSAAAPGVYGAGDVARWHNPLFGVGMRIEHRTNAAEQGMAAARNLLRPQARRPFAPVPYFWSEQYDLRIHAFGYLRGHDAVEIVDGDLAARRFLAVYRRQGRVVGALTVGMPPAAVRPWRQAITAAAAPGHG
ncbi:NAD(P)/FAD-dependent oxidoreductase [Micromonospora sp. RP3T]|uniref:NAD(P)/FAD-dependent oxidoreductase n=1 Tax=Micromonospora sp. RP3T TaxID=2135446 RepID=UPI000D170123|nr:FAD-dependent oxidoreductase [Micromonospora sp. RP3T]PTA47675.1 FAD-dependent oxidoreductase [Micromonospora sp. RP3T]